MAGPKSSKNPHKKPPKPKPRPKPIQNKRDFDNVKPPKLPAEQTPRQPADKGGRTKGRMKNAGKASPKSMKMPWHSRKPSGRKTA